MQKHTKKSQKGFTIIELLVVMVILGVLFAIAVPKLFGTDEGAYVSSMISDAKNAITAEQLYYSANKQYSAITVSALTSSQGKSANLPNSNIEVQASPFNQVNIQTKVCTNGGYGFTVRVISSKTQKKVLYDSCVDTAPYVN